MSEIRHQPAVPTRTQVKAGGDVIDRHRHDDHQLIYVSAGVLAVRTERGSWTTANDRAVWLPAGAWHEHRFYGASSFHSIGFPVQQPPLLPTHEPTVVAVDALLRELLVVLSDAEISAPEARRIRAVLKDRMRGAALQPVALPTPADPRLAEACHLVEADLTQPRSLPWLAARVHASERTLSRLFRTEFAMTYPQWRNRLRVLTAMIMLAEGTSVTDTAHRCGFSTTSAFVDTFHRATGTTPGPHRQKQPATRSGPLRTSAR